MKTNTTVLLAILVAVVACKEQESEIPKAIAVPEEAVSVTPIPTPVAPVTPVTPVPLTVPDEVPAVNETEAPRVEGTGEELQEKGPTAGERLDHAIDATGRGLQTAREKTANGVSVAAEKTGEALQTTGEKTEEGVKKGVKATGRFFKKVGEKLEGAAGDEEEEP